MNTSKAYNELASQVRLLTITLSPYKQCHDIELTIDEHPKGDFVRIETSSALVHIRLNKNDTESSNDVWEEELTKLSVKGTNKEKLVVDATNLTGADNIDMSNTMIQNNLQQVSSLLSIYDKLATKTQPLEHKNFSPAVKNAIQICDRLKNHFNVE